MQNTHAYLLQGGTDTSTRDKAFLRFLLHADYISQKRTVLSLRGEYMASPNAREPFYTEFDYVAGVVRISVLPAKSLIEQVPAAADMVDYQLRRLASDPSKMSLDVAVVRQGRDIRYWIFPMRSTSSELYDGLVQLVHEKGVGNITAAEYEESLELLGQNADLIEMH
ncbi:hypothetical protein B0H19DRAFT_1265625 [Mycena capillaripes]|nr:hypothetical protein B0H19DRAFT_1265625 [Mycena capillaripes]